MLQAHSKKGNTTKLNFADVDIGILNIMGGNLKMWQTILSESSSSIFDAYPTSQVLNNLSNMIQIRSESSSFYLFGDSERGLNKILSDLILTLTVCKKREGRLS